MKPTPEQQDVMEAFATGEDLVVVAGAGTGKTSTLRLLAQSRPGQRGLYVAFNKTIATEASASFPRHVQARTAHSLAFAWARTDPIGQVVLARLKDRRRSPSELVSFLELTAMSVPTSAGKSTFVARIVLRWVQDMLTAFQQSTDPVLDPSRHLPHIPGVAVADRAQVALELAPAAKRAWAEMCDPDGGVAPVPHSTYLKLWGLAGPQLPAGFVLFDEAQDASPVIAGVVTAQQCQRVMVGDPAQAIYGFTGAVDAMSAFDAPHRLQLSRSWRFGEQIAAGANTYLHLMGQSLRLSGNPQMQTVLVDQAPRAQAVLCRGNVVAIAEAMAGQSAGMRMHIVGGVEEPRRFVQAAEQLMTTGRCTHPELAYFPSWEAVREHAEDGAEAGLRTLVRLVDEYGTAALEQVLGACTQREDQADVLVSTVHKAKGREWDSVDLSADLDPSDTLEALGSGDPSEQAAARDELRVGYVALTRARRELGAGVIAAALAKHGFPAVQTTPAPHTPTGSAGQAADCGSQPARLACGDTERQLIPIPLSTQLWQQLHARYGNPDVAAAAVGLLLEQTLAGLLPPQKSQTTQARRPSAVGPTGANSSLRPPQQDYGVMADQSLGIGAADTIRALLNEAIDEVVHATGTSRAGYTDEVLVAMFGSALGIDDLVIHRSPGRSGYSLTSTITGRPGRLAGSNFGTDYSGPAILRRLRAR